MTLIDRHDHTAGNGVQITPLGMNINTDLNFNDNFAINLAGTTFLAQSSTPANGTVYVNGVDLYYIDLLGNPPIQITANGGIAGSPGSISNLSAPASAAYVAVSKTFIWQSDTNIAANLDAASLLMRNISPNSTFALTLSPPAALSSNYTLTLPAVPGASGFLQIDTSGNITAPIPLSRGLTQANLSATAGITKGQLAALGQQVSSSCGNFSTSSGSATTVTNLSVTITTTGKPVMIMMQPDQTSSIGGTSSHIAVNATSGSPDGFIYGYNGASQIYLSQVSGGPATNSVIAIPTSSIQFMDTSVTGTPGTYTYTIKASYNGVGSHLSVFNAVLVAYEL